MKSLQMWGRYSARQAKSLLLALPVLFLAILISGDGYLVNAQSSKRDQPWTGSVIDGQWFAEVSTKNPGKMYFSFQRRSDKDGEHYNMMSSRDMALGEFQGLPADVASAPKTTINFSIVREAGTFQCEGVFNEGKGVGFWTLTPNPKFISAMRERGYDNLTEQNLLSAAMNNITAKFSDDLKSAGYGGLTFEQLRRSATHDLTPQYIRELKSAGYENLTLEELVRARNHDIDTAYLREVKAMGFERQTLDAVIRMRNHDISPAFISEMKSAGFENLTIENLIRLKNHDVSPAFVSEIKAEGYADISPDMAIRLKNHDVNRDFIRRARAQGYTNVSLDEMIRLRNREVVK
ncbi:MAG TPA: hypothetical protein VGO50_17780 [Pyrinomonadaceae bacterium]|jgi:uncharacterized protein (UPF0335 family)|nr:hypothetical protein [Pyrinomonadaceae bacterium]